MTGPKGQGVMMGGDAASVPDEEKTLSLMSGVARPEGLPEAADLDLQSMKTGSRMLNQGTLVVVAVFLVAAGSLYAMRLSQSDNETDPAAKEVEARVDQALAKLTKTPTLGQDNPLRRDNLDALFDNTEQVVAMFVSDPTTQQVPIEYVKKNPFTIPITRADPSLSGTAADNQVGLDREARERLRKLQFEFADLELQTVMRGRVPIAIISDQMLRPGDLVGSFTVKAIHVDSLSVDLENEGRIYTLTMENAANDNSNTELPISW